MSTETEGAAEEQASVPVNPPDAADSAQKLPVKRSWRRKYRKMRVKFEDIMNTSNILIKDEFKAIALARRLQEQNDQLLDVLSDMNENPRLPVSRRFDLRATTEIDSALTSLETDPERRLQELRNDMINGIITQEEYSRRETKLRNAQPIAASRQLASLESRVPHSTDIPDPAPEGLLLGEHAPGYMSPSHEEEYLLATDTALADPTLYDPNGHDGRPLRVPTSSSVPSEKDLTIRNPDSVYNWLRKNQPQVFLQDKEHHENLSEKSSAKPTNASGRVGKRASAVPGNTPGPKTDQEMDEDGFIPETGTGKGRKAKQEDDSAYRPKGGSSRGAKRKREDGDPVPKGGRKKNRASGGITAS